MGILEQLHNSLIFFPTKDFFSSPLDEDVEHEDVYIKTEDDETLHGYFLPVKNQTKVMLYLHGNADNVSTWYTACTEIQKHVHVNALIVDYRGYGKSTGKPTVKGVINDVLAMYKYLIARGFKGEDISVYGRSLGGALALELTAREQVRSTVVQSSFTSLKDIAKALYPFVPEKIVINGHLNSVEHIKKISVPILISHGDRDEIIPVAHSYKLYATARNQDKKKLIILKGAMHNNLSNFFDEEYFKSLNHMFL